MVPMAETNMSTTTHTHSMTDNELAVLTRIAVALERIALTGEIKTGLAYTHDESRQKCRDCGRFLGPDWFERDSRGFFRTRCKLCFAEHRREKGDQTAE
jgi:hypothetical protein